MIELTFSTALMLYLGLTLICLLGLWGWSHFWKVKEKPHLCHDQAVFTCEYCHYVYLEELRKTINRCPQCNSFNKNNLPRILRK